MQKRLFMVLLSLVVMGAGYSQIPKSRTIDFDYEVNLNNIPLHTSELKVWLPFLPQTPYQEIEDVKINPPEYSAIASDKTYNNKILSYTIKSPKDPSIKISVHYRIKRLEYSNKPGAVMMTAAKNHTQEDRSKYLEPNRLVTLSPKIKELSAEIAKDKITTIAKARAIYDYVFNNLSYDKTIPGWGNGDTERACLIKAGNCTDFHSLFISLARARGIPAKFVIGVPLPQDQEGEIKGYHCWAEFYDETIGWIPVDISEAWKDKTKYEYYFGNLAENRIEFTQGRDIVLEPTASGEPLNYFFYPYAEVDGKIFKDVTASFRFKAVEDIEDRGGDQPSVKM